MTYVAPTLFGSPYSCPHCTAIAKQDWWSRGWDQRDYGPGNGELHIARCQQCDESSVWVGEYMYYPIASNAPPPNLEMPEAVKKLYIEASDIVEQSPRGAAALLRLSIQVLCKELGEEGKDINKDIGSLVSKGLPKIVQESLDVVRVTGNEAVHPGQIDTDDPETAQSLFKLVNIIVEYMIAMPKQVSGLFSGLPAEKLKGIADRDKPKTP